MLFMGRMIAAAPDVSHADYIDAFKKLTSEEHEVIVLKQYLITTSMTYWERSSNSRRNVHESGSRDGHRRAALTAQRSRYRQLCKLHNAVESECIQSCRQDSEFPLSYLCISPEWLHVT
ncbi:hypothetical protein OH77DRAFT_513257 [Trametes cingulata]|nr:hypothetical protein OH77DRAFT_513257 [Trametes cingulata]